MLTRHEVLIAATRGSQTWKEKDGFARSFPSPLFFFFFFPPLSFSLVCEPAGPGEGFNLRAQRIPWQRSTVTDGRRTENRLGAGAKECPRNFWYLFLTVFFVLAHIQSGKWSMDKCLFPEGQDFNSHVFLIRLSEMERFLSEQQ